MQHVVVTCDITITCSFTLYSHLSCVLQAEACWEGQESSKLPFQPSLQLVDLRQMLW